MQAPFTVVSSGQNACRTLGPRFTKQAKISIGSIHALSHRHPHLIPLPLTFKSEPWSVSVCRRQHGLHRSNYKTVHVEECGRLYGFLTIIGGGLMTPGDSIDLQFTTAASTQENHQLPCYQISACLQGAEYAINLSNVKTKSRSYVFDTDFERLYPGASTVVSLSLNLPEDCPVTISTEFVEISVTCRIDFTVKAENSDSFRFLTVEFPCIVVHSITEGQVQDDNRRLSATMENQILDLKWPLTDFAEERRLISSEVINDLNALSLHLLTH